MLFSDDTNQDTYGVACGEDFMNTEFLPEQTPHVDETQGRFDGAGCFRANYTRIRTGPAVPTADPPSGAAAHVLAADEEEGLLCHENTGYGPGVFISRAEIDSKWTAGAAPPPLKYEIQREVPVEGTQSKRKAATFKPAAEVAAAKRLKRGRSGGSADQKAHEQRLASIEAAREKGLLVCGYLHPNTGHVCGQSFLLKKHFDAHVAGGKHDKAGGTSTQDTAVELALSSAMKLAAGSRPNSAKGAQQASETDPAALPTAAARAATDAATARFKFGGFAKMKAKAGYRKPQDLQDFLEGMFVQGIDGKKVRPTEAHQRMKMKKRSDAGHAGERYFSFRSPHGRLLTVQSIKQWFSSRTSKKNKLAKKAATKDADPVSSMKVDTLRAELLRRGLGGGGLKAVLVLRLKEAMAAAAVAPSPVAVAAPSSAAALSAAAAAPAPAAVATALPEEPRREDEFDHFVDQEFEDDGLWFRIYDVKLDPSSDTVMAYYYPTDEFTAENVSHDDCEMAAAEHVQSMLPEEDSDSEGDGALTDEELTDSDTD